MTCSRDLKMKLMVEKLMRKKSVAFKTQDSKNEEESGCQEEESDEEMTRKIIWPTAWAGRFYTSIIIRNQIVNEWPTARAGHCVYMM